MEKIILADSNGQGHSFLLHGCFSLEQARYFCCYSAGLNAKPDSLQVLGIIGTEVKNKQIQKFR